MKLLSVVVPCYNSQDYMEHAVETLLPGGERIEILIVDDGSSDRTAEIADRLEAENPGIIRAIHQKNAGHGGALNTGMRNATGMYFKVVDSDDWVDSEILLKILDLLETFSTMEEPVDLLISNYVYDKVGVEKKRVISYGSALSKDVVMTWDDVGRFRKWEYLLMHSLIYRTQVLRDSGLELPEHTFYVDNIYATAPLIHVKKLYYFDVDFYHYFIGRDDQSVQEQVMIKRIDQQLKVNKILLDSIDLEHVENKNLRQTILNYHMIVTAVSSIRLIQAGTPEHLKMKEDLWDYIEKNHPWEYKRLRYDFLGIGLNTPGKAGRSMDKALYKLANKVFGFN